MLSSRAFVAIGCALLDVQFTESPPRYSVGGEAGKDAEEVCLYDGGRMFSRQI